MKAFSVAKVGLLMLSGILLLYSCGKKKQNASKITGTWKLQSDIRDGKSIFDKSVTMSSDSLRCVPGVKTYKTAITEDSMISAMYEFTGDGKLTITSQVWRREPLWFDSTQCQYVYRDTVFTVVQPELWSLNYNGKFLEMASLYADVFNEAQNKYRIEELSDAEMKLSGQKTQGFRSEEIILTKP